MRKSKKVIQVRCGLNHTVAIVESGDVYSWGYAAQFCCGVETTNQIFIPFPVHVYGLSGKAILNKVRNRTIEAKEKTFVPKVCTFLFMFFYSKSHFYFKKKLK